MTDPASGDAFVACSCGGRHWGRFGAAGLMLVRGGATPGASGAREATGVPGALEVLLQHRAQWSDEGGTWALPGGALHAGEEPVAGALREAAEEAGVDPAGVQVVGEHVLDHGAWLYTTVVAAVSGPQRPTPTDRESIAITWVRAADVPALPLLRAFRDAWPTLLRIAADAPGIAGGTRP